MVFLEEYFLLTDDAQLLEYLIIFVPDGLQLINFCPQIVDFLLV